MDKRQLASRLRGRCTQRWADLSPRERGRYCAACDTEVIDLTRVSLAEAIALTEGGACVRVRLNEDGLPMFREPPRRGRGPALVVVAATLGAVAGGCETGEAPTIPAAAAAPPDLDAPAEPPRSSAGCMLPIPSGVDVAQLPTDERTRLEAELDAIRGDAEPTDEQLALTAQKHRRRTRGSSVSGGAAIPPPIEYLGFME
ncbi:MAG: hypothetical protein AB7S26_03005 [Sandaracinaceae bacterium]